MIIELKESSHAKDSSRSLGGKFAIVQNDLNLSSPCRLSFSLPMVVFYKLDIVF